MKLDKKDLEILEILKENSKLTSSQISKKTMIPITTVHNRVKKLEKLGVVKGYTISLDYEKLDKPILAFILVEVKYSLPNGKKLSQQEIASKIKSLSGVEEVHITAAGTDLIVKVRFSDIKEMNEFVIDKLRKIDGVDETRTIVVMSSV